MRQYYKFTPIITQDIKAIMKAIRLRGTLSKIAYCRLHNYIVTLERISGEIKDDKSIPMVENLVFLNN